MKALRKLVNSRSEISFAVAGAEEARIFYRKPGPSKRSLGERAWSMYPSCPDIEVYMSLEGKPRIFAIDLDYPDVEDAKRAVPKVLKACEALGLERPLVKFSGKKGLHLLWAVQNDGDLFATTAYKSMAELAEKIQAEARVTIDPSIYRNNSLFRFPWSVHLGTGAYSCMVDPESLEEIPYDSSLLDPGTWPGIKLDPIEPTVVDVARGKPHRRYYPSEEPRPCVTDIFFEGVEKGHRHDALVMVMDYLRSEVSSLREAERIVLDWNKRCQPPENEKTVTYQVQRLWASPVPVSCEGLRARGFGYYCKGGCVFDPSAYEALPREASKPLEEKARVAVPSRKAVLAVLELVKRFGGAIKMDMLVKKLGSQGISEREALSAVAALRKKGRLYEPRTGMLAEA